MKVHLSIFLCVHNSLQASYYLVLSNSARTVTSQLPSKSANITKMAAQVEQVVLPVIDILKPSLEVGKEMLAAAIKYGFLYIDTNGTSFTEELVNREFAIG